MKKLIALIMCVSVLGLASCGKNETAETVSETTTAAAEEAVTEQTVTETEAETTAETTETTPAETESKELTVDEIIANKGDELWTIALMEKISEWKDGNIAINFSAIEDDVEAAVRINVLDKKAYAEIVAADLFSMITISDGQYVYMVDDKHKVYCKEESTASAVEETDMGEFLIDKDSDYENTGVYKEEVNGVEYICEEFVADGEKMKYYFNADGEICGIGVSEEEGVEFVNFTVEFYDKADDSVFALPDGYTEVTADEYAMYLFADILSELPQE